MKDDQRVGSGMQALKIATSLGVRYFMTTTSLQNAARHAEAVRRVEQRAVDRTDTVADVQYRDVDARTGRRLPATTPGSMSVSQPKEKPITAKSDPSPLT